MLNQIIHGKNAYEEVTNIMENEKINFHTTMRKCLELNKSKKTEEATIEMVRIKVSKKVFHARTNVVFARYSANHVGRYANKDSGMPIRVVEVENVNIMCAQALMGYDSSSSLGFFGEAKLNAVFPHFAFPNTRIRLTLLCLLRIPLSC